MTNYIAALGTEPLIFHCHHYNVAIQQAVEDALGSADGVDARALLTESAEIAAYPMLLKTGSGDAAARLAYACERFRLQGFGLLDASHIEESGGRVRVRNSHYGMAEKGRGTARSTPMCFFAAGYIAAAAASARGLPSGSFDARETRCIALGAECCEFEVTRRSAPKELPTSVGLGTPSAPMPLRAPRETMVDETAVIEAVSGLPLGGNEEGLAPAFGVYLTRHFANYYNRISYEMVRALEGSELLSSAQSLLVEAGHICAFNTFGGIMKSPEWEAVVKPMIRTRTDWVDGMVAVINALGWGRWSVAELVENERLVVRVDSSYESSYFLAHDGRRTESRCYFCRGGVAGLMNLLYVGDITAQPELSPTYYTELFSSPVSFLARETKCRSKGDDWCEFVAERHRYE